LAYVEGIEAYFGLSVAEVAKLLRRAGEEGQSAWQGTRFDHFLDTYADQLLGQGVALLGMPPAPSALSKDVARETGGNRPLDNLPVLDPGDTRPLLALRVGDHSPWGKRVPAGDAKTVLLYSREVVLLDPSLSHSNYVRSLGRRSRNLDRREAQEAWRARYAGLGRGSVIPHTAHAEGLSRTEWLIRSVEQYASLSGAIRRGYVDAVFVDPVWDWSSWRPGDEYVAIWEKERARRVRPDLLEDTARDVLLAVSVAARNPGVAHVVAKPFFEEALLHHYRAVLSGNRGRKTDLHAVGADLSRVLGRLFELNLDGVDFVRVPDLVTIRDDELFAETRLSVRDAVAAAECQSTLDEAASAAREVFEDRAAHYRPRTMARALRKALIPKAVTYAVGGFVAVQTGAWQPLLPLAGQSAIDIAGDLHRQRAVRAQRNLYIALSQTHGYS